MRGLRRPLSTMLAFVNLDERVPPDHPLRIIKRVANKVLSRMSDDFDGMHSRIGRASVPPERTTEASASDLPIFDTRRESVVVGVGPQHVISLVPRHGPYGAELSKRPCSQRTEGLLRHTVGRILFEEVAYEADRRGLMSDEHFSVDGTLIKAAASIKSVRRGHDDDETDDSGSGAVHTEDFHGEKLRNSREHD